MNLLFGNTRRITAMAVMLALIATLTFFEHLLPPLPFLPPGVRLGLSNIVALYALFYMGLGPAFLLAALKAVFVALTRGAVAGLLSASGGLLSLLVTAGFAALAGGKASLLILSVAGAVAHNIGQIVAASAVLGSNMVIYYLPALVVSGVLMGSVTGTLLRVILPLCQRLLPETRERR